MSLSRALRIGVIATSSPVGPIELARGIERLRNSGFDVVPHASLLARHFVHAGTDAERAAALLDFAFDDAIDAIWCARGGYGAARVVAELDRHTHARGTPRPKLLIGYSDVTALHAYVQQAWGWQTLHAPMVALSPTPPTDAEWAAADALVRGDHPTLPYEAAGTLGWIANPPAAPIEADLVGGNLSILASMAGTPWQVSARGRILFLEDVGERLYRLDRCVVQLEQAGLLDGAAAIVLGDFSGCGDESPTMLDADGSRVAMRPTWSLDDGLREIFGRVAERYGIPVARGLPVGHGPSFWPLPLGARYALTPVGALRMVSWDGLRA